MFFFYFLLQSYTFLGGCSFLVGVVYTVLFGLGPPVLSDQFGFTVEHISQFFLVLSFANIAGAIFQ